MEIRKLPFIILLFLAHLSILSNGQTFHYGVNLAGAEFGSNMPGVFNTDYTYPNNEELDYYHSKGLDLIRLPFSWERIQHTLNDNLNSAELNRIKTVIQAATTRNMYVLLDFHNSARYKKMEMKI